LLFSGHLCGVFSSFRSFWRRKACFPPYRLWCLLLIVEVDIVVLVLADVVVHRVVVVVTKPTTISSTTASSAGDSERLSNHA
jgi:hypothetical protein